jgi:hypothetical protein
MPQEPPRPACATACARAGTMRAILRPRRGRGGRGGGRGGEKKWREREIQIRGPSRGGDRPLAPLAASSARTVSAKGRGGRFWRRCGGGGGNGRRSGGEPRAKMWQHACHRGTVAPRAGNGFRGRAREDLTALQEVPVDEIVELVRGERHFAPVSPAFPPAGAPKLRGAVIESQRAK